MRKMLNELRYIFNRKQKIGLVLLLIAIGIGTVLELLGVTIIMPFISVVMDPLSISKKWYLSWMYDTFQFSSDTTFMIFLAILLIVVYLIKNIYLCVMYNLQYHFTLPYA